MTDRITVLDDVFALLNVNNQNFVTGRRVLINCDLLTIHLDDVALFLSAQTHYH